MISLVINTPTISITRRQDNTIKAGRKAGIPVAMCGEMAGDASYTRFLLGMGLKEFSVHPNAILEIKQIINESHIGKIRELTQRVTRTVKPSNRAALLDEMNELGHTRIY